MFFSKPLHIARAEELKQEPPKGGQYSVPLPGSEQPGRSKIYRSWNAQKALVKTLDPQVCIHFSFLSGGAWNTDTPGLIPGHHCS